MSASAIRYREITYYSVIHDLDITKIMASHPTRPGIAYFGLLRAGGKDFRDRREQVLEAIGNAIQRGKDPGEIHIEGVTV